MGQKIHPIGFRLASRATGLPSGMPVAVLLRLPCNEDIKVRDFLKKKLANASVSKIVIERPAKNARITIHSARPGVVIGKKGEDIEALKAATAEDDGRACAHQHRRSAQA